jgi:hypothetical protein
MGGGEKNGDFFSIVVSKNILININLRARVKKSSRWTNKLLSGYNILVCVKFHPLPTRLFDFPVLGQFTWKNKSLDVISRLT